MEWVRGLKSDLWLIIVSVYTLLKYKNRDQSKIMKAKKFDQAPTSMQV